MTALYIAGLQIVADLIPCANLTDHHNTLAFPSGIQSSCTGRRLGAEFYIVCIDKADTVHDIALSLRIHGNNAENQHRCQKQADNTSREFHTLPSVLLRMKEIICLQERAQARHSQNPKLYTGRLSRSS